MTASDFKATVLAVLDDVAQGDEVQITKHGKPVARLVPVSNPSGLWGRFVDTVAVDCPDEDLYQTGQSWALTSEGGQ
ncbi:MAG: type II toxin-antitoxin system prevent-host-death family antitoxin [Micrococcales bacterium]|nr:type II toxin-antitoxin system prevent-host-death family antitoxin [Micrococcales bacterium]